MRRLQPISRRINTSATEKVDTGLIPGRIKSKLVFITSPFDVQQLKRQCKASTCVVDRWQLDSKTVGPSLSTGQGNLVNKMELQLQTSTQLLLLREMWKLYLQVESVFVVHSLYCPPSDWYANLKIRPFKSVSKHFIGGATLQSQCEWQYLPNPKQSSCDCLSPNRAPSFALRINSSKSLIKNKNIKLLKYFTKTRTVPKAFSFIIKKQSYNIAHVKG